MTVGELEKVALVKRSDSRWEKTVNPLVGVCHLSDDLLDDRQEKLQGRLSFGESVEDEARELFMRILLSEHQAFALSEQELEESDVVEHVIDTGNAKPVKTCPRRLPYALHVELEEELDRLESTGCIEPSSSPYTSNLVLVRKKDVGLRVCVDYRGVNKDTTSDRYPIPRIDELIDTISRRKGKVFRFVGSDERLSPSQTCRTVQAEDCLLLP